MRFENLNLIDSLLRAVREEGYTEPTPIQEQSIPHILAGRDILGNAQTGTGKTAAFALPILQILSKQTTTKTRPIRMLTLTPTRELATQIRESLDAYGRHLQMKTAVIYGGVNQKAQVEKLKRGVDMLVATPGRLLDLMKQGYVHLNRVEILVLDEADRMLDMGFLYDVQRIIDAVPTKRQTLLFSATMPPSIQELTAKILTNPVHVEAAPESTTVDTIEQMAFFVEKNQKLALLQHLLKDRSVTRALIFTRTKHGANRLTKQLAQASIYAEAIHGNKSQSAREKALDNFKRGKTRALVATDIAARGIDVEDISHVINYDLPNEAESYVHRIGRTGRAGSAGKAFSFCDAEERSYLRDIERLIRIHIPVAEDHPYVSALGAPSPTDFNNSRRAAGSSPNRSSRPSQGNNGQRNNNRNRNQQRRGKTTSSRS
jgi:ATP-dependent RNA helicase RhlE